MGGNNSQQKKSLSTEELKKDKARGCMFGLFIGDALGSYLENTVTLNSDAEVRKAMLIPGGGFFKTCPGQGTDDSEIALSLMYGLLAGKGQFDMVEITRSFGKYYTSPMWCYGPTSYKAISKCSVEDPDPSAPRNAAKGGTSASDGALMRCMPMAIWCHNLPLEQVHEAVPIEVKFTHDLPLVANLVTAYCVGIRHLLRNPDCVNRRKDAFSAAREAAAKCPETLHYLENAQKFAKQKKVTLDADFNPHVGSMVHSKNGFTLAFYFLLREDISNNKLFDSVMYECCRLAGDTDTNAAIAGALIGAYLGFENLPQEKVQKVMTCDSSAFKVKRPDFLQPGKIEIYSMID